MTLCSTPFINPFNHENGHSRTFEDSSVVFFDNIPFVQIKADDLEQAGYAIGNLLKPELLVLQTVVDFIIQSKLESLPFGTRRTARLLFSWKLRRAVAQIPDEFRKEVYAVADAAGVSLFTLLFCTLGAEIMTPKASHACSAFISPSTGDPNSHQIHGHNLDYQPSVLGYFPCVVRYLLPNIKPHGIITFLGSLGALQGWSEPTTSSHPITVSLNVIRDYNPLQSSIPMALQCREGLMKCSTISDFYSYLSSSKAVFGWMVSVSSPKERTSFIMDFAHNSKGCSWSTPNTSQKLACVNRYMTKEARGAESHHVASVVAGKVDKNYQLSLGMIEGVHRLNEIRFLRFSQLLDQYASVSLTLEDAFVLLSDVSPGTDPSQPDIGLGNMSICKENNLQCVVFDVDNQKCLLSCGGCYAATSAKILFNLNDDFLNVSEITDFHGHNIGFEHSLFAVRTDKIERFRLWHIEFTLLAGVGKIQQAIDFTFKYLKFENSIKTDWKLFKSLDCDYDIMSAHCYFIHSAWVDSGRKVDINPDFFVDLCLLCHSRYPHVTFLRFYAADVMAANQKYQETIELLNYVYVAFDRIITHSFGSHDDRDLLGLASKGEMYSTLFKEVFFCSVDEKVEKESLVCRSEVIDCSYLLVKCLKAVGEVKKADEVCSYMKVLFERLQNVFGLGKTDLEKLRTFVCN
ncbi:hypothetical protein GEMRC1_011243 [Eukaryota sp. GEM-RC1]